MNKTFVMMVVFPVVLMLNLTLVNPYSAQASEHEIVAQMSEAGTMLLAVKREGHLEQFLLIKNGMRQEFPYWRNSDNPAYGPQMFYNDISRDGKKELIIVLTKGHGTGVLQQEVHVMEDHYELLVDDPMAIVYKQVDTKLTAQQAEVVIGNKKTVVNIESWNISPGNLFSDVGFGSIVKFDVENDELTATVAAQISPAGFIGNVKITYELYKNRIYQAKSVVFIPEHRKKTSL